MSTKLLYDPVNPLQNLSAWFLNHNIVSEPVDAFGLALLTVAVTVTIAGAICASVFNHFEKKKNKL